MIVALDAQLTVGTATGIGEYVNGLTASLRDDGHDVRALREPGLDPWRFDRRVLWDQVLLPLRARMSGADVLHCTSGTMPLVSMLPAVVTVHDVAWLRVQRHARFYARYYFGAFSLERYRHARAIVVDSAFSRAELLAVAPHLDARRVHVVYPGVAGDFIGLADRASDGRTILVVGTVERRKNMEIVVRALAQMPRARVVSVGPATPYRDECARLAADLGVSDRVEFRGYVDRSTLLDLYRRCAVVAMPSRYEGFGYAAAQALCAGVPTIVAACASLPEVVGGDAPALPPDDVDAWVHALRAACDGNIDGAPANARASAIARFAWSCSAHALRDLYERVLIDG